MDQKTKSLEKFSSTLKRINNSNDKISKSNQIREKAFISAHCRGNPPIDNNVIKGFN